MTENNMTDYSVPGSDNIQRRFWSTTQLAEAAGVSRQYIVQLLNNNTIDGYKAGNTWVITAAAAKRYLASRRP